MTACMLSPAATRYACASTCSSSGRAAAAGPHGLTSWRMQRQRSAPLQFAASSRRASQACRAGLMEVVQVSDLVSGDALEQLLYDAGQAADALVAQQLTGVSPVTYLAVLGAGLLTSLSPCTLSVLPLTIGYIGGYSGSSGAPAGAGGAAGSTVQPALLFALGLATTLAALGLLSSSVGQAYGQIGDGLPLVVAVVAIIMGLNLLEVLPLRLPSLDLDVRSAPVPPAARAYLAGLTFALAASPCSTPVLATLLAYVSNQGDPVQGSVLLLLYSLGYVAPLLVAATFTGSLKQLLSLRQYSAWITPASGALLVGGGSYAILTRLAPYLQ